MTAWSARARTAALGTEKRREAFTGYLFILPSYVGFLVFVLGPVLVAFALSFARYDILTPPRLVGLSNYTRMLTDQRLITVYLNTIVYVIAAVVLMNVMGLALAVLLNRHLPGPLRYILRSAYFFPSLVALVYVSIIWQFLLQQDTGIVNYYLAEAGMQRIDWLNGPQWVVPSVILVDVWRNVGFAMLIYLAALQDVPREIVEAAQVDGASRFRIFRSVVLPLISPAIFFNVTITIIGAFQIYESVIVLTGGGPGDASRSVVMYIAEKAFDNFEMGYASAIAMTLFTAIMLVTIIQFRVRRRWVFYE
jgi:multiple sugar transport system permease protein